MGPGDAVVAAKKILTTANAPAKMPVFAGRLVFDAAQVGSGAVLPRAWCWLSPLVISWWLIAWPFSWREEYRIMFGIGTTELLVVMVVMVILFGHRLPSLMRSLGQSATSFKQGLRDVTEIEDGTKTA